MKPSFVSGVQNNNSKIQKNSFPKIVEKNINLLIRNFEKNSYSIDYV